MSTKQSNMGRSLVLVLLVSMLSAAAGAAGIWYLNNKDIPGLQLFKNHGSEEENQVNAAVDAPQVELKPIFLELEPFTFTLRNQNASRILYLGLTLQLKDIASKERLEKYMPIVRSRIITDLGDIPPEALSARETKDAIRTVVTRALEVPLGHEPNRQAIADVLINAYVVQ